jgi:hypothetical protein
MVRTHSARGPHPFRRYALALSLALGALVVPSVFAQQPTIVQPATPQPPFLPLNQPSVFGYADAQGTGTLTLTDIGPDPATGGREFKVSILKNGVKADGSGLTYLLNEPTPASNNLFTFTVVAPNGVPLFYQVKMGGTAQFQGQGTFHTVADPTQIAVWSLFPLPQLALSRTQISFPSQHLGQTSPPLCFTISNPSAQPVFISSVTVQNCSSDIDPQYIDCTTVAGFRIIAGDTPGFLAPGQSRDVCITVTPTEIATFDGHVMINTNVSTTPLQVDLHAGGQQ